MATDYNKILLDKGYTQAQIDAMRWAANAWASNKDIVAAGWTPVSTTSKVTTPTTPTTTTTTTKTNNSNATKANTNIAKPEYQWTGTVNNPTPSYQHQWEGNYVYNPTLLLLQALLHLLLQHEQIKMLVLERCGIARVIKNSKTY